jgi:hypothetical protein
MMHFLGEALLLLPFLYVTYLVLEMVEVRASGALGKFLERARSIGPLVGGLAGVIPQCGLSAVAASFYAAGVVSVGTLIAVFLSTSDEMIPVLVSRQMPLGLIVKIMLLKVVFAIATGFFVNFLLCAFKTNRRETASVVNLCEHSRCGCHKHKGVFYPALIHTLEVFFFILVVSGIVEAVIHFGGADVKSFFSCKIPFVTEMTAGLAGLIPNCAVSVGCATLYAQGAISEGALLASSFTGAGVGFLVLFRINRSIKENLMILFSVYFLGVVAGFLAGKII